MSCVIGPNWTTNVNKTDQVMLGEVVPEPTDQTGLKLSFT